MAEEIGKPVTQAEAEVLRSAQSLRVVARQAGEVLSRSTLIEHVWDFAFEGDSNVVDVYVGYLRQKIDRPFGHNSLETVRGAGYRLREGPADAPADPD